MSSYFPLATFAVLLIVAVTTNGRKDPGEYWEAVMKEEPMPEVIQGLVRLNDELTPQSAKKTGHDCRTSMNSVHHHVSKKVEMTQKPYTDDFEPRPSATASGDDEENAMKKHFADTFEPRPSATAYSNDKDNAIPGKKRSADDFEQRPSLTARANDKEGAIPAKEKHFADDFEPRPNVSAYGDDKDNAIPGKKRTAADFEPRPSVTSYVNDANMKGEKANSEPRPNTWFYDH